MRGRNSASSAVACRPRTDESERRAVARRVPARTAAAWRRNTFRQWLQIGFAFTLPLIVFGFIALLIFFWLSGARFVIAHALVDRFETRHAAESKQQELARSRNRNLREQMDELERMIEEAPRVAQETSRRQREEILQRASEGRQATRCLHRACRTNAIGDEAVAEPAALLRKERREGRLIFLVLVIALAVAVIWLATHFHF